MKYIFLILFALAIMPAHSQSGQIVKTVAITYTAGQPTWVPTPDWKVSELSVDTISKYVYLWDRPSHSWARQGRGIDAIAGAGPPLYTPKAAQTTIAIDGDNVFWRWNGTAWEQAGGGSGGGHAIYYSGSEVTPSAPILDFTPAYNIDFDIYSDAGEIFVSPFVIFNGIGSNEIQSSGVTPGTYNLTNLSVDADGRVTSASSAGTGTANRLVKWTGTNTVNASTVINDNNGTAVEAGMTDVGNFKVFGGATKAVGGRSNVLIGRNVGSTTMGADADQNVLIGFNCGQSMTNLADYNVGIGYDALAALTTGNDNLGVGYYSLQRLTTGRYNMALGTRSLNFVTTGIDNVAVGGFALEGATGTGNIGIGTQSGRGGGSSYSSNYSVSIGPYSGGQYTGQGSQNINIGAFSGTNLNGGASNCFIGYGAGAWAISQSNKLAIDNNTTAAQTLVGGDFNTGQVTLNGDPNALVQGAALEVKSTTGGVLFPRLTTAQRDAISPAPTDGTVIYNITTATFQGRAGGSWVNL